MLEGATPLARDARNQVLPFWDDRLDLDQEVTPRYLLQFVAEECFRRALHRDFWVIALEAQLEKQRHDDIVITDLRHINEWKMLHDRGATIIGVHRTLPWWVKSFYEHMESLLPGGVSDICFDSKEHVQEVVEHAYKFFHFPMRGMDKPIHVSEWQHLLLPYDHVVSNTKSKNALWQEISGLLSL
jgi:hypothetical protein